MKSLLKTILLAMLFSSFTILAACHTVQGAFQGAGQDTKALVNELQLNDSPPKHHPVNKKPVTTINTGIVTNN